MLLSPCAVSRVIEGLNAISHHIVELSVRGMPGHGLCLVHGNGIKNFALGETLVTIAWRIV
jgi:hypothetical protein